MIIFDDDNNAIIVDTSEGRIIDHIAEAYGTGSAMLIVLNVSDMEDLINWQEECDRTLNPDQKR
jgi:hypothetical protein